MVKKNYNRRFAIFWFIISLIISNTNDILMKYIDLPVLQVTSCRYIFASLYLLPFLLFRSKEFITTRIYLHLLRGGLLAGAIVTWCIGLRKVHVTSATLVEFTIPIFTLILAAFILKEKISLKLWIITLFCFSGIFVLFFPGGDKLIIKDFMLVFSAFLFSCLDITNKKYVGSESMMSLLFYSSIITSIICIIPAMFSWQVMSMKDIILLAILGALSNLILYCLLLAYKYCDISFLSPFRYLEFLISMCTGYLVFNDVPYIKEFLAAGIIIPSTLLVGIYLQHKETR